MSRESSSTRQHILAAAESILSRSESSKVHISEVAKLANVGIPTVYYHFESRAQLIAEAQASTYLKLIEPLHNFLCIAEAAITSRDEASFFSATGDNLVLAWSFGQLEAGWKITKLVLDVWSDPKTRSDFSQKLDAQFDRWIIAFEQAQELGWINREVDVMALVATCWAGSMGQAVFSESVRLVYSLESVREFFEAAIGATRFPRRN